MPFLNSWVKLDISVNDEWINGMDFDDLQTCLNEIDLIDEVLYNQPKSVIKKLQYQHFFNIYIFQIILR